MPSEHDQGPPQRPSPRSVGRLGFVLLALGALAVAGLFASRWRAGEVPAWGWDESMHAALPGAELALALEAGDVQGACEVVHRCERYPPFAALLLAGPMALLGPTELVARSTLLAAWLLLGVVGLGLVARETARRLTPSAVPFAAAFAGGFALVSPLANRYAPTVFIEPLFAGLMVTGLYAHLRARRRLEADAGGLGLALLAGLLLAAAVFTKWNYGALLVAGLALDALVDVVLAVRRRALAPTLARLALLFGPLALAAVWWLLAPAPFGADVAARHRAELLSYLESNRHQPGTPVWMRRLFWYRGVAPHPALLVALALGAVRALRAWRVPTIRTLWLLALVVGVPCTTHHFFLDRFLLAPAALLFALAAAGWSDAWAGDRTDRALVVVLGLTALAAWALVPTFSLARHFGFPVAPDPAVAAFQRGYVEDSLGPVAPPASNGLPRAVHEELLDLVAGALGPRERVGWIGQSSEVSPAALHFGLLARGGDPARFRADARGPMDLAPVPGAPPDPPLAPADVVAWARAFDALVMCEPVDLKGRRDRAWVADAWQAPLVAAGWAARPIGTVELERPSGPPSVVEVRLARRP